MSTTALAMSSNGDRDQPLTGDHLMDVPRNGAAFGVFRVDDAMLTHDGRGRRRPLNGTATISRSAAPVRARRRTPVPGRRGPTDCGAKIGIALNPRRVVCRAQCRPLVPVVRGCSSGRERALASGDPQSGSLPPVMRAAARSSIRGAAASGGASLRDGIFVRGAVAPGQPAIESRRAGSWIRLLAGPPAAARPFLGLSPCCGCALLARAVVMTPTPALLDGYRDMATSLALRGISPGPKAGGVPRRPPCPVARVRGRKEASAPPRFGPVRPRAPQYLGGFQPAGVDHRIQRRHRHQYERHGHTRPQRCRRAHPTRSRCRSRQANRVTTDRSSGCPGDAETATVAVNNPAVAHDDRLFEPRGD